MIGTSSETGDRRGIAAVLVGAGIALVASGGLGTAAVAAASPAAASLGATQAQPVTATNPTPSPWGAMMGGSGGWMMDDDDWGWHHGSLMTRTQARQAARTWVASFPPGGHDKHRRQGPRWLPVPGHPQRHAGGTGDGRLPTGSLRVGAVP